MELLAIIIALSIATISSLVLKRRVLIEAVTITASSVALVSSILIALKVSSDGVYKLSSFFTVDALSAIVMIVIGFIGFAATIYSLQYLRQETSKEIIGFTRVKQYFVLLNLFLMAMFLAISASSPIFAWIAIEATTLSTAFLISFYNKPSTIEAAWKYLIINSIGLLFGFFGTILYFTAFESTSEIGLVTWQLLSSNAIYLDPLLAKVAFIFVLIGYGTKVGLVPMHTWKPDTYSKAPAPLGALLSGALLPVAFVMILKFKDITDSVVGADFTQQLLIVFGALSVAVAALILFNAQNYKRLLAYSSIEHAGIMALGFAFGGIAIYAAVLHLIYHSCIKASLFFASGNIMLTYNSAKIYNVRGALSVIPITSAIFILGALAITGTPPFGMFFTKMYILTAGMEHYPVITVIVLFFMAIVFIGFLKHLTAMFFGKTPEGIHARGLSMWLMIPPFFFLIIMIILSFYIPPFLSDLINDVVSQYK